MHVHYISAVEVQNRVANWYDNITLALFYIFYIIQGKY